MRTLSRWVLTLTAVTCTSCLPTITLTTIDGACKRAKVSKPLFEVPEKENVAVWFIDNQCEVPAKVDVKDFAYEGAPYPVTKACYSVAVPAHSESVIFCEVNDDCRQAEPYDYSVYIGGDKAVDPQVIIKRDKRFEHKLRGVNECPPPSSAR